MGERMFNAEQEGHMAYLASLPADQKCDCGWDRRGECGGQCYGKPERGGFVPCGAVDARTRTTCVLRPNHSGNHRGSMRVGCGATSHDWPRSPEPAALPLEEPHPEGSGPLRWTCKHCGKADNRNVGGWCLACGKTTPRAPTTPEES